VIAQQILSRMSNVLMDEKLSKILQNESSQNGIHNGSSELQNSITEMIKAMALQVILFSQL
jgi:hypothetical protein